jgi:hypothetical protein
VHFETPTTVAADGGHAPENGTIVLPDDSFDKKMVRKTPSRSQLWRPTSVLSSSDPDGAHGVYQDSSEPLPPRNFMYSTSRAQMIWRRGLHLPAYAASFAEP